MLANTRSTACKQVEAPAGGGGSLASKIALCDWRLRLLDRAASTLGHNLLGILIQRPRLRNRFHSLLHLGIGFQQNLEAFLLIEGGHEHFLLDLPLDPLKALSHV